MNISLCNASTPRHVLIPMLKKMQFVSQVRSNGTSVRGGLMMFKDHHAIVCMHFQSGSLSSPFVLNQKIYPTHTESMMSPGEWCCFWLAVWTWLCDHNHFLGSCWCCCCYCCYCCHCCCWCCLSWVVSLPGISWQSNIEIIHEVKDDKLWAYFSHLRMSNGEATVLKSLL